MAKTQVIVKYETNKPLRLSLPDCYWDILFTMAHMHGRDVKEYATARSKQIIVEDVVLDDGYYGKLISDGWKDTLASDPFFRGICG